MAAIPGLLDTRTSGIEVYTPHTGRTVGYRVAFFATWQAVAGDDIEALAEPLASVSTDDIVSTGGGDRPEAAPAEVFGFFDEREGIGAEWWSRVHVLPRDVVDFGSILSQTDQRVGIHNAFRKDPQSISAVVIPISGISLPDFPSLPVVVPPCTSIIDPASTALVPLGQIVRAAADGPAIFRDFITFSVAGLDDLLLEVAGLRVVFIAAEWESPVVERLEWLTEISTGLDRTEQRVARRRFPRQSFQGRIVATDTERQMLQSMLLDWMDQLFGVALWHEAIRLTAAAAADDTTLTVDDTTYVDLRVGGQLVLFTDQWTFDVLEISSISTNSIGVASGVSNDYPIGTLVAPVRSCRMEGPARMERSRVGNLVIFEALFGVDDNTTGAPTGSTSPFSTYDGKVLFDEPSVVDGLFFQETYERLVTVIDNESGKVYRTSPHDTARITQPFLYSLRSRQAIYEFRRLLTALAGSQVSFWVPTFGPDLTLTQPLVSGTATMTISNVLYSRLVRSRNPMAVIRLHFTDGTSLVRVVQSAAEDDAFEETLTVDTNWPAARTVDEIERIEFYREVRLAGDSVEITYDRPGRARASFTLATL